MDQVRKLTTRLRHGSRKAKQLKQDEREYYAAAGDRYYAGSPLAATTELGQISMQNGVENIANSSKDADKMSGYLEDIRDAIFEYQVRCFLE